MVDSVAVRPVHGRSDLRRFIRLPHQLYRDDPSWTPHLKTERRDFLDPRRNPFFEHAEVALWLAERRGRTVGRISSHIDHSHLETHGDHVGMFGFFDCENDPDVVQALVARAAEWVRERGMQRLRGPLSFSQHHECGLLVEGYSRRPVLGMPYNPSYLAHLVESCGMEKSMDLLSYTLRRSMADGDVGRLPPELVDLSGKLAQRTHVTVREMDFTRFDAEIEITRRLYNEAWRSNWGFVPVSGAEYSKLAHDLRPAMDRCVSLIAESAGRPVGFALSVLDLNPVLFALNGRLLPFGWLKALRSKRKIKELRLILFGVLEQARGRGADALLILETLKRSLTHGFNRLELAWVLETNAPARRLIENLGRGYGVEIGRRHRIYELEL